MEEEYSGRDKKIVFWKIHSFLILLQCQKPNQAETSSSWIKNTYSFLAAVNVDSSHTEYTLSSLTSDTLYMVRMAAYTDEGGKDGPEFTFTTPKFGKK